MQIENHSFLPKIDCEGEEGGSFCKKSLQEVVELTNKAEANIIFTIFSLHSTFKIQHSNQMNKFYSVDKQQHVHHLHAPDPTHRIS